MKDKASDHVMHDALVPIGTLQKYWYCTACTWIRDRLETDMGLEIYAA